MDAIAKWPKFVKNSTYWIRVTQFQYQYRGKVCIRAKWHQAGAYPGFCSMKRPGVFLFPPGWDIEMLFHPSIKFAGTHLNTWARDHDLGCERHCESKVSCPRTQRNVLSQGSNPDRSIVGQFPRIHPSTMIPLRMAHSVKALLLL